MVKKKLFNQHITKILQFLLEDSKGRKPKYGKIVDVVEKFRSSRMCALCLEVRFVMFSFMISFIQFCNLICNVKFYSIHNKHLTNQQFTTRNHSSQLGLDLEFLKLIHHLAI